MSIQIGYTVTRVESRPPQALDINQASAVFEQADARMHLETFVALSSNVLRKLRQGISTGDSGSSEDELITNEFVETEMRGVPGVMYDDVLAGVQCIRTKRVDMDPPRVRIARILTRVFRRKKDALEMHRSDVFARIISGAENAVALQRAATAPLSRRESFSGEPIFIVHVSMHRTVCSLSLCLLLFADCALCACLPPADVSPWSERRQG